MPLGGSEKSAAPRSTRRAGFALAAGLAVGLAGATAPATAQDTLERVRSGEPLRIGVANERPYAWVEENGRATGEAPEIARQVLSEIAPESRIKASAMDFGALIPRLQGGEIDVIAAGMFITPARCAQVAFSEPTYVVGEAFAVRRGNPAGVTDYRAISEQESVRVGLIAGTVEYNYALVTGIPADRAPLYRSFDKAIEALKAGEVEAVGLTSLTAQGIAAADPEIDATEQFFPVLDGQEVKGYGGFAFRKEDQALRQAFDAALKDFLGSEAHWQLVEPFGFTPEMAADRTVEELCAR
ncbi:MAG: ectoine/hydroxyectoine ABC transporter substrate-binding protein EhuB [Tistlia sp.]|uniref:ectoine/hydroxyectoine ABC transporter substrate-binding protein EhuB n=1 Tax=Tistlia sp. TaxID=3057121 RepID=UPI0034A219E0